MTQQQVEVWVFYPDSARRDVTGAIQAIRGSCESLNWEVRERPVKIIKIDGRPFGKMKSEDAVNLYKRIHRAKVGIWQFGLAHAPARPEADNKFKDYIQLGDFVRHKAFHCRTDTGNFLSLWDASLADFQTWLAGVHCENEGDPRCLPFHIFKRRSELEDLATAFGRSRFADNYGSQSERVDASGLCWRRPQGGLHGRETLHVAGCQLTRGFHWDVAFTRTGGKIVSPEGVWRVEPNSYVNIYPDAHVRAGAGSSRRRLHKKKAR